jgi:hypothetical protein
MATAIKRNKESEKVTRRFGSEADVETLTSISRRTLQQDRLLGRTRFPWYRSGRRILYDLTEVEATIRAQRIGGAA